ncbi:MAG: hypothetical protein ACLUEQ_06730 [Cloacibacillus evryensis]
MKNKICGGAEAMSLVKDGDFLACSGNMNSAMPEELMIELEKRFLATGGPQGLTIMSGSASAIWGRRPRKAFSTSRTKGSSNASSSATTARTTPSWRW